VSVFCFSVQLTVAQVVPQSVFKLSFNKNENKRYDLRTAVF